MAIINGRNLYYFFFLNCYKETLLDSFLRGPAITYPSRPISHKSNSYRQFRFWLVPRITSTSRHNTIFTTRNYTLLRDGGHRPKKKKKTDKAGTWSHKNDKRKVSCIYRPDSGHGCLLLLLQSLTICFLFFFFPQKGGFQFLQRAQTS